MANQFTPKQIEALKKQFSKYDQNNDNSMGIKQINTIMKSLGEDLSPAQLQQLIRELDADSSGTIDFLEFLTLIGRKFKSQQAQHELKEVFDYFDINGDGYISPSDLKEVLADSRGNVRLNDIVNEMIKYVDIDQTGVIYFEEFVTIMMTI